MGGSKPFSSKTIYTGFYILTGDTLDLVCFVPLLQLCYDLTSSLNRLLDVSDDTFWRNGWVHIRVQHQMAFIFNGLLPCLVVFVIVVRGSR